MRKLLAVIIALTMCLGVFAGCGGEEQSTSGEQGASVAVQSMPESVDAQAFTAKAQQALSLFQQGEYTQLTDMFLPELRTELTQEAWEEQALSIFGQTGEYVATTGAEAVYASVPEFGDTVAVVMSCEYENVNIVWQALFDLDMNLLGLVIVG